jgi:hypothetical protein
MTACVTLAACILSGIVMSSDSADPVTQLDAVNPSLRPLDDTPNLETPQACVENFVLSCRDSDYERAARSLNFRLLGGVSGEQAARRAEKLYYVLNQQLWVDWEALPDRRDGMLEGDALAASNPMIGQPRKSLSIGGITVDGRRIPIRLERVRGPNIEPVCLFSAHTVDNIELLYKVHGPRWLERSFPNWARDRVWGGIAVWKWVAVVLILLAAPIFGYVLTRYCKELTERFLSFRMNDELKGPVIVAIEVSILARRACRHVGTVQAHDQPEPVLEVDASVAVQVPLGKRAQSFDGADPHLVLVVSGPTDDSLTEYDDRAVGVDRGSAAD